MSCLVSGEDWRSVAKSALEQLEGAKGQGYTLGFLYISDRLAGDSESLLNLFKSVLGIKHWIGAAGLGVCGCGQEIIDAPALSVMLCQFDAADFCIFPSVCEDTHDVAKLLKPWLEHNEPLLVAVHGDPLAALDPAFSLAALERLIGGFLVGGLTSSRSSQIQFADEARSGGVSGAVFSSEVEVASVLSQGCRIIGPEHQITRVDGQVVLELDGRLASQVFEEDLRSMAIKTIDRDPDDVLVDEGEIPEEYKTLFQGEVHAALLVPGSDQGDYLVRHITGFDPDEGSLQIAETSLEGQRLVFVHRDQESVFEDLSAQLVALRTRVTHERGCFEPKGALYISCVARAFKDKQDGSEIGRSEAQLIRDVIGDVPLAGFYAAGEINAGRLYGYSGILVLFL